MNRFRGRQTLAVVLILCILVVGGLASAQSITHESHHAHHQKAAHSTALCSWMCAAGQGWEGASLPTPLELIPLEFVELASLSQASTLYTNSSATRGPPVRS